MSGEWWHTAAGAASLMGLVLGVILGAVTWLQHRDTKRILDAMDRSTKAQLDQMDRSTKALLERMETAAEEGGTDAP
jgi:gas vesicle protein